MTPAEALRSICLEKGEKAMQVPKGFYVLYQPKYRTPSVFDLNEHGRFNHRPPLSDNAGFRLLVDAARQVMMQCAFLVVPGGGATFQLQEMTMALSDTLDLDEKAFVRQVPDAAAARAIMADFRQWRDGFLGNLENSGTEQEALAAKLGRVYTECQSTYCRELASRNSDWVNAALPRLLFDFRRALLPDLEDRLLPVYQKNGGEDTEDDLVRKIMLFYRVLDNCARGDLLKPNGHRWQDEDEIWDCWIGFAGSETEAKRICQTLGTVLHPMAED